MGDAVAEGYKASNLKGKLDQDKVKLWTLGSFPENLNFCWLSAPRNIGNRNDLVNIVYGEHR